MTVYVKKTIVFKGKEEDDNEEAYEAVSGLNQSAANPASNAAPADPPASHDVGSGRIVDQNNTCSAEDAGNQANSISQQDNNNQGNDQQENDQQNNDQQQNDQQEQNQEQQHQLIAIRAEGDRSK